MTGIEYLFVLLLSKVGSVIVRLTSCKQSNRATWYARWRWEACALAVDSAQRKRATSSAESPMPTNNAKQNVRSPLSNKPLSMCADGSDGPRPHSCTPEQKITRRSSSNILQETTSLGSLLTNWSPCGCLGPGEQPLPCHHRRCSGA